MRLRLNQRLQGEQLDFAFPRRGRPTRRKLLERCGQMRLGFDGQINLTRPAYMRLANIEIEENLPDALQLILSTAITPENPITDADVPF